MPAITNIYKDINIRNYIGGILETKYNGNVFKDVVNEGKIIANVDLVIKGDLFNYDYGDITTNKNIICLGQEFCNNGIVNCHILIAPNLKEYNGNGQINAQVAFVPENFTQTFTHFAIEEIVEIQSHNADFDLKYCNNLIESYYDELSISDYYNE